MEKKVPALVIHPETAAMLSTMENGAAGLMIKALCAYAYNDDSEYLKDRSLRLAFELLRNRIDRDRAAYADKCVKNQENVKSRWEKCDRIQPNTIEYDRIRTDTNDTNRIEENKNIKPKEKDKKKIVCVIPEKLNTEEFLAAWEDWLKYRKAIKKAVNDITAARQLDMLAKWDVDIAVGIINRSIENGWTGLFPPQAQDKPPVDKSITGLMSIKVK